MTAVISVCVPVYNCGDYLPFALDSILSQSDRRVEVVVYDGGSTDQTPQLMKAWARPGLHYHRAPGRGGIDADLAACVARAEGQYCWLFSGDDVMRPGALARALEWIGTGADVLVCRHTLCDIQMRYQSDHPVLLPVHEPSDTQFADAGQRQAWFARAASTEAFFSFLSGIVVRRDIWHHGRVGPEFAASCWAHAARLLSLSNQGLRVIYVPEVWLDQRGENDSFARWGTVNRYRIGIEGYQAMAASLFGAGSAEAFHIRRVLRNEFSLEMFLSAKILCRQNPALESRELLDSLFARLHCDPSLRSQCLRLAYRLTPVWAASCMRTIVRQLRQLRPPDARQDPRRLGRGLNSHTG